MNNDTISNTNFLTKIKIFFAKILSLNLSANPTVDSKDYEAEVVVKQVCKEYVAKICNHGKGMTDYCLPCNRINNA